MVDQRQEVERLMRKGEWVPAGRLSAALHEQHGPDAALLRLQGIIHGRLGEFEQAVSVLREALILCQRERTTNLYPLPLGEDHKPIPLPLGEGHKPIPLPLGEGHKPIPPLPLGEGRGEGKNPLNSINTTQKR